MTKMATTPIYGKAPSKSSFLEPVDRFLRDLVYSIMDLVPSDDPRLALTYFTARSDLVVCVLDWGNLLNGHLMEKTNDKID